MARVPVADDRTWDYHFSTKNLVPGEYTFYSVDSPDNLGSVKDNNYDSAPFTLMKPIIEASASSSSLVKNEDLTIRGSAEGKPPGLIAVWIIGDNYLDYSLEDVHIDRSFEVPIDTDTLFQLPDKDFYVILQHPMENEQFDIYPENIQSSEVDIVNKDTGDVVSIPLDKDGFEKISGIIKNQGLDSIVYTHLTKDETLKNNNPDKIQSVKDQKIVTNYIKNEYGPYNDEKFVQNIRKFVQNYVNDERLKHNLHTLERDPYLDEVAFKHSLDMAKRGYFENINPEGEDPIDRYKKIGYDTEILLTNGEKTEFVLEVIAKVPVGEIDQNSEQEIAKMAFNGWMDTKDTQDTILDPYPEMMAVGIGCDGKNYYITLDETP
ncbi:MAG TPA: CAP domain-containing protein [Methanospirillum sp.]|nr:CAP domain-containing protein [Methanospirillum sp.]